MDISTSPPEVTTIIQVTPSDTASTVAEAGDQSSSSIDSTSSTSKTVERTVATVPSPSDLATAGDPTNPIIQSTASATAEGIVATLPTQSHVAGDQTTSVIEGTSTASPRTEGNIAPISTNQNVNSPSGGIVETTFTSVTYDKMPSTTPLVYPSDGTENSITNAPRESVTKTAPEKESLEDYKKGKDNQVKSSHIFSLICVSTGYFLHTHTYIHT